MCCIREWSENAKLSFVGIVVNLLLAGVDTANFFAQSSFSECGSRPDHFWRAVLVFHMLVVGIMVMCALDGGLLGQLLPGYDFQSRIRQLPMKTFLGLEIAVLIQFFVMVIVSYSTCDVQKVWVGIYYWALSVLGFLFAVLLSLLWLVAGHHLFRYYRGDFSRNHIIVDYRTRIHKEKSEILQRSHYKHFRQAMDRTYIMDGFTDLDLQFMEKYAMHTVESSTIEREFKEHGVSCIYCEQPFKTGEKMRIFELCLHAGHFVCMSHSLRVSDQCFCGYTLRSTLTEPCFPEGKKESILELLGVKTAIPLCEAIICSRNPDSDDLHYEDFWDIKEAGLDQSIEQLSGSPYHSEPSQSFASR